MYESGCSGGFLPGCGVLVEAKCEAFRTGTPPTGRSVRVPGATFVHVEGDKIRSKHVYHDRQIMAEQLGATITQQGTVVALSNERPAHLVQVQGFWMDMHDVTNAEFAKFVEATGYVPTAERPVNWGDLKKELPPGTPKPGDSADVGIPDQAVTLATVLKGFIPIRWMERRLVLVDYCRQGSREA